MANRKIKDQKSKTKMTDKNVKISDFLEASVILNVVKNLSTPHRGSSVSEFILSEILQSLRSFRMT